MSCLSERCIWAQSPLQDQTTSHDSVGGVEPENSGEENSADAAAPSSGLQSEDVQIRRAAAVASRDLRLAEQRQWLPAMIERIRVDEDGQVRFALFATLTDMGPEAADAIDALAASLRSEIGGRGSEKAHQNYRAALALAAIGPPAVQALRGLLGEDSVNVRAEAAMALGRIGPQAAAAASDLVALLREESSRLRDEAARALGRIGEPALEPLLTAWVAGADDPSGDGRAALITALGAIPVTDERRANTIQQALSDSFPPVRTAALRSVQSLNLPREDWKAIMLANLQHDDPSVRLAVINAVSQDPDRLSIMEQELLDLLQHESDGVAEHAAFLLHDLGPNVIPSMLETLQDRRARVDQIGHAIALIGTTAVDPLMQATKSSQPRVRQAAALALGSIRPVSPATVVALAKGLDDPDPTTPAFFLVSIGNLSTSGRIATAAVEEKLTDSSPAIRAKAIDVLFRVAAHDQAFAQRMTTMIDDADPDVQCLAMDRLRAVGPLGRQSLPAVIERLGSPSPQVRQSAAAFISSHGSGAGDAVASLTAMLDDDDATWRLTMVATLGQLGSAARPAFDDLSRMLQDPNDAIRAASVEAIGNLGMDSQALLPPLAKALHDEDGQVRAGALRIIRRLGDDGIALVPDIIPLAANEDERRGVQRILERLERVQTDKASLPLLAELLEHPHVEVQRYAIRFIGLAGPSALETMPRLQELLSAEDEDLRSEAQAAIDRLESSVDSP